VTNTAASCSQKHRSGDGYLRCSESLTDEQVGRQPFRQGVQQAGAGLTEKPGPSAARALERRHGARNLLVLEGRARVTADFIRFAHAFPIAPGVEPKLALAIGAYAAAHPVVAVETNCEVIDLGAPVCRCEPSHFRVAKTSARQGATISDVLFPARES
jgi:hypothetical protein